MDDFLAVRCAQVRGVVCKVSYSGGLWGSANNLFRWNRDRKLDSSIDYTIPSQHFSAASATARWLDPPLAYEFWEKANARN